MIDGDKWKILWTLLWFIFIGGLCFGFGTLGPLWLLILWFMGVV